jgi:NADPH:quinone reductase-like Zn-dependent oxidoreductase
MPDIENGTGPASALFINDKIERPVPKDSHALIKVYAFGLNRMDLMQREGRYKLPDEAGPILGVEFSGVIEELGGGDTCDFKAGDEVFGLTYGGKCPIPKTSNLRSEN